MPMPQAIGARTLAMQKQQRPGGGEPPSAPVWLDHRGEWQVQGVVRHDEGNVRLSEAGVHVLRTGRRGWLRRGIWEEEQVVRVETLTSVQVIGRGRRQQVLDLELQSSTLTANNGKLTLKNCRPPSMLRALVDEIQARNQALRIDWPSSSSAG